MGLHSPEAQRASFSKFVQGGTMQRFCLPVSSCVFAGDCQSRCIKYSAGAAFLCVHGKLELTPVVDTAPTVQTGLRVWGQLTRYGVG
jgi:hypothetical protein